MELSSYLPAIQKIKGESISEKYKTLNRLAKQIIGELRRNNEPLVGTINITPTEELPEVLIPLVKLEIARLTKNSCGIIDAIKSTDNLVFKRAIKVKWFFNGSNQNHPNVGVFKTDIFPYVSLSHRLKLIRTLASNLARKQPTIAQDFYTYVSSTYGKKQARPLLKSCSESFVWDTIIKHQIVLYLSEVMYFYAVYPGLLLKYLKLSTVEDDPDIRNLHKIPFYHYHNIFGKLLKKYPKTFVDIIVTANHTYQIYLNDRETDLFLMVGLDRLIDNPKLFLPMLSRKRVTKTLPRPKFEKMFQKLYPEDMDKFDMDNMKSYAEYLPEDEQLPMILSNFKTVYGVELISCDDLVTSYVLELLPANERITYAREKLQNNNNNWHTGGCDDNGCNKCWDHPKPWICYLPTEESIPAIKDQIRKTEECRERGELLMQLIHTCRINNDNDRLVEVLEYVISMLKNEDSKLLLHWLCWLALLTELEQMPSKHWEILHDVLKYLHIKKYFINEPDDAEPILVKAIQYNVLNGQSITEVTNWYIDIVLEDLNYCLYIFSVYETPEYEQLFLEECGRIIIARRQEIEKRKKSLWTDLLVKYVQELYYSDSRNRTKYFSIGNYPALLMPLREILFDESLLKVSDEAKSLKEAVRINDKKVYRNWLTYEEQLADMTLDEALVELKRNPSIISTNFEIFYNKCKDSICKRSAKFFLNTCRWYQDVPLILLEHCVQDVRKNKDCKAVVFLALLLEGQAFQKFIIPYAPKASSATANDSVSQPNRMLEYSIPTALERVSPPVPANYLLEFCGGDEANVILRRLQNYGYRAPAYELAPFCQELIKQRALIKHGIRMYRNGATITQLSTLLSSIFEGNLPEVVHHIISKNVINVFSTDPSDETWAILLKCFEGPICGKSLDLITKIDWVPNEYVAEYAKKVLETLRQYAEPTVSLKYIDNLLNNLSFGVTALFPNSLLSGIFLNYGISRI